MNKLAAVDAQSDGHSAASPDAPNRAADHAVARVRTLMLISGLTTLVAIAAVVGVIGYRVYRAGDSVSATAVADGIIILPYGARVAATSVADGRIVLTLDVAGATEIRTYDLKSLRQTGRITFATAP